MSNRTIKDLREKRAKLVADARVELDKITDKTPSAEAKEIEARWDAMDAEADQLKAQIDRLEKQEDAESELRRPVERQAGRDDPAQFQRSEDPAEAKKQYEESYLKWCRFGLAEMKREDRAILQAGHRIVEGRAQSSTTTAGGYTIPEGFWPNLESAMLAYGNVRKVATVISTATGNDLPMPTTDDTSNEGEIISENSAHNEQDIAFGQVILGSFTYSSKIIRVPVQLLQDSAFNFDGIIGDKFGERLGRITNRHFTVGTGSSQPKGIVTAAGAGVTAALPTAVTTDDIYDLKHSVDPAYRNGAVFMFNDSTLKALKKLKDSQNRPLWAAGFAVREPDTIDGDRYEINQHMASMGPVAKSMIYGNMKKYYIRDVKEVTTMRLVERYAEYLQVGFLAFLRTDGDLLDAGTDPVKYLVHASA